MKNW